MIGAEDIVFEIMGNAHRNCYWDLRLAIELVYARFPEQLSMNELADTVAFKLNGKKSGRSVTRSLARAADDVWDYGDREVLQSKYGFRHKPTPKELVYRLAKALQTPVEYRVFQDAIGRYGILAKGVAEERWLAIAPFLADESKAAEMVAVLNEADISLEEFRELLLNGEISLLMEGKLPV